MDVFVARQPIFNVKKEVVAYELLYRNSRINAFPGVDGDTATSALVSNSLLTIGLDSLIQNKKAFINFTQGHLNEDTYQLFAKESLVIEILENLTIDNALIEKCKNLRTDGFTLALDDFTIEGLLKFKELFDYVNIIKVDFMKTTDADRYRIVNNLKKRNLTFLAEKVETEAEFDSATSMGYTLFQGYFFSKPVIIDGKDITPSKYAQFQLLLELAQPEPDLNLLSKILGQDLSLSYKVLRLVNSAVFRRTSEIKSIKHALVLLGLRELQRWLSFVIVQNLGTDQPEELVWIVLIRAKFCEAIAHLTGNSNRESEIFLLGLFSCIDVFFNRPIGEIVAKLPLAEDVKDALIGKENSLFHILKTVIAYEKGEWDLVAEMSTLIGLDKEKAIEQYLQVVSWANQIKADTIS